MTNTLIALSVLVVLAMTGVTVWRMSLGDKVRRRDYVRARNQWHEAQQALRDVERRANFYTSRLDVVGAQFADEVLARVAEYDDRIKNLEMNR